MKKHGLKLTDPTLYPDTWDEDFVLKIMTEGLISSEVDLFEHSNPDYILVNGHEVATITYTEILFCYGPLPSYTSIDYWSAGNGESHGCFVEWRETLATAFHIVHIEGIPCIPLHLASQPIVKGTPAYDAIIDTLYMMNL